MAEKLLSILSRINRAIAISVGVLFLTCAGLVLIDICLRRVGASFGGTDEISGYVMAIGTAWGMAFGLSELSHIRIDFLRRSVGLPKWRAVLDLLSIFALSSTVSIVALKCWPVVETTLRNSSGRTPPGNPARPCAIALVCRVGVVRGYRMADLCCRCTAGPAR